MSGNPTLALANDLAGIEGLATAGLAARTAADTWATRSVAVTASTGLSVSNGDGVAGNPTLAGLAASETVIGVAELATQTETNDGTDDARIVTPLKLVTRPGTIRQIVSTQTGAVATGATVLPVDDTIPTQSGPVEGNEYMTLAITPRATTNKLRIDVTINLSSDAAPMGISAALFQDTTANALAVVFGHVSAVSAGVILTFSHVMDAGTTSSTTFKVRAGPQTAATLTFNGAAGGRYFGGVFASSIRITEYVP